MGADDALDADGAGAAIHRHVHAHGHVVLGVLVVDVGNTAAASRCIGPASAARHAACLPFHDLADPLQHGDAARIVDPL